jgi:nicotinate-nucleotide adenylyltransferase
VKRVGVFGGSFDPPHVGHVLAATVALLTCEVDSLLVIPTYEHPFQKPLTEFPHRLVMCQLAMSHLKHVRVSPIERTLGGTSVTHRTLDVLQRGSPGTQFRLVIGADVLSDTHRWKNFARVVQLAPLLVIGRSGFDADDRAPPLELPHINSGEVRRRLASGLSVEGWVPRKTLDYINANQLYQSSPRGRVC